MQIQYLYHQNILGAGWFNIDSDLTFFNIKIFSSFVKTTYLYIAKSTRVITIVDRFRGVSQPCEILHYITMCNFKER